MAADRSAASNVGGSTPRSNETPESLAAQKHDCEYRIEADCALREVDSLELRVDLLREGLSKIIAQADSCEWETPGHPMNEWTKREPILRLAREALDVAE